MRHFCKNCLCRMELQWIYKYGKGECIIDKKKNSSSGDGRQDNFIMAGSKIFTMEAFCQTVRAVMQKAYPECKVEIQNIREKDGACHNRLNITCEGFATGTVIQLGSFYREFLKGYRMTDLVLKIAAAYEDSRIYDDFPLESIHDYGKVKSRICYALINRKENYPMLQETPHIRFLDLAIIFYIPLSITRDRIDRIIIKKTMMEGWGITNPNELYKAAHKNTCRILRGRIDTIDNVIKEMGQVTDGTGLMNFGETEDIDAAPDGNNPLFVATNSHTLYGAAVILYDRLLKSFADLIGDDLIILPSSVHECMIVPASDTVDIGAFRETDFLRKIVADFNREMHAEEVLSDNIYRYDRNKDQITIIR